MERIVIQSFRTENVPQWIARCMESVRYWAEKGGWDYRFIGDELLDMTPPWYRDQAAGRLPVITDLGRLIAIRDALVNGYQAAAWIDADVLIFAPDKFDLPVAEEYMFSREIWIQPAQKGKRLKAYRNVHNAVCCFNAENPFLDFYIDACKRIVRRVEGGMPNQIVGTKLLSALHNMIGFPLIETAGMISPVVAQDIVRGTGDGLSLLVSETNHPVYAANLCSSLVGRDIDGVNYDESLIYAVIASLLDKGEILLS